MDEIQVFGSDYYKKQFKTDIVKEKKYNKRSVRIGKILAVLKGENKFKKPVLSSGTYELDMSDAIRLIIIGIVGSGKTYTIRAFIDRFTKTGYRNFTPTDVKNEFYTSKYPNNKSNISLDEYEKPLAQNTVTFRPTFFKDQFRDLPKENFWFSIPFEDLDKTMFMSLIGGAKISDNHKIMAELLFKKIKKTKDFNLNMIDEMIDNLTGEFTNQQKATFKNKFLTIVNNDFCSKKHLEYYNKLEQILQKYNIVLNMEGYDKYKGGSIEYPEIFMTIILQKIRDLRIAGKVKPLMVWIEETKRFIDNKADNCFKYTCVEGCQLDRGRDISYAYIMQNWSKDSIPEDLITQCRYYFYPSSGNVDELKKLLEFTGITYQQYSKNLAVKIFGMARKLGRYNWIIIDRITGECHIVNLYAPMSKHKETKNVQ